MRTPRLRMMLVVTMMGAMAWGCASVGDPGPADTAKAVPAPTPEEEVVAVLTDFHTALKGSDVDDAMVAYSNQYRTPQGGDKSSVRVFLEGMMAQGAFSDTMVDMGACKVVVTGDTATARPVTYQSSWGRSAWEYRLGREPDGIWRITRSGEAQAPPVLAPEQQVLGVLADFHGALEAGDVDKVMQAVSQNFRDSQGGDKAAVQGVIENLVAQGSFAGVTVDMDDCAITVTRENAVAAPVIYESSMGRSAREYRLNRESDGSWRITSSEEVPVAAAVDSSGLNVPPPGFTALFNGRDFNGWQLNAAARSLWSVEDGVLTSLGPAKDFAGALITEKKYRDFVFTADFRMRTVSDSGIWFRGWPCDVPRDPPDGRCGEQVNLGMGWMGHPMFFHFLPKHVTLREDQKPRIKHVRPETGKWYTIQLRVVGATLSVAVDGDVILDRYEYPKGFLSMEPGEISLQKHDSREMDGQVSNAPIEFRNVFVKEIY